MNIISTRSSVLPILCEHRQFSAIMERTQSDHSDCRHWMEGVSTTKPGTESFFSTLNRAETSYPVKRDRLLIKNATFIASSVELWSDLDYRMIHRFLSILVAKIEVWVSISIFLAP